MLEPAFSPFPTMFSTFPKPNFSFSFTFYWLEMLPIWILSMSKVSINLLLCGLYRLTWVNVFYTCPFSFSVQPFTTQFRLFSILYRKHFENIVKKEKMLVTSIFSFLSQSFLIYLPKNKILIFELHLFGLV